ncbi:GMC family oxidoreductase N-terminal domain-containing protein [Roseovarius sp. MBR-154]
MTRISTKLAEARKGTDPDLGTTYDVIVIGSGYGGAISAQMLTEAGQSVLLLERGREILPGAYPRDLQAATRETQIITAKGGRLTDTNGMLDLRIAKDMSVVVGCGLGGTSLINANVALPADRRVFDQTDAAGRKLWPKAYQTCGKAWDDGDKANNMPNAYKAAHHGLGSTPLPEHYDLPKLRALEQSAKALNQPFQRPPINVTFENGCNAFGNPQAACTLCGDCCGGCNYGAKNTTLMNYLPHAAANGAVIVTEAEVSTVTQGEDGTWRVRAAAFGQPASTGLDLKARRVVLAAGTLGSTEILMRSARAGLPVAQTALGKGFSGNGDVLAFGFDANITGSGAAQTTPTDPPPLHSIGAGAHAPTGRDGGPYRPGPCIAGTIRVDMDEQNPLRDGVLIEEGVAPGALSMIYPAIFFGDDVTTASLTRFSDATRRLQDIATLGNDLMAGEGLAGLSYSGATARMQSYLLMSHDDAGGQIVLDDRDPDHPAPVTVCWPDAGKQFPFPRDNEILRQASDGIEANYLPNPIWSEPYGWKLVTTHPVGGCRMADDPGDGVVDADCRVYTGEGTQVHEGLMVCDGAVIASSLGVNPLLTISAITIRAMNELIAREGWQTKPMKPAQSARLDNTPPKAPPSPMATAARDIEKAIKVLEDWVTGIGTEPETVRKELRKRIESLFAGLGKWTRRGLDAATWTAFETADMSGDIGPALSLLAGYLQRAREVLLSGKSEAKIARDLVALITEIAGEFPPGLAFSEEMEGALSEVRESRPHPISDAYAIAAREGTVAGYGIDGQFVISTTDIERMLAQDCDHEAVLSGSVVLTDPAGKAETQHFTKATFQLLRRDAAEVASWLMVYDGDLDSGAHFHGVKTLRRRADSNWWTDLTTLDVDLTRPGQPALRGRMTLGVQDLVKQAQTVHGTMASDATLTGLAWDVLRRIGWGDLFWLVKQPDFLNRAIRYAIANYGMQSGSPGAQALTALGGMQGAEFFGRLIFEVYGGLPAYLYNFPARNAPPDPMPPLAGVPSETVTHVTADGAPIRLTRFQGGTKGPVIVANGFGFRGMGFAMNTYPEGQDQSLVGMLAAAGYDVWIFDHRASPANDMPGAPPAVNYTIDDIAATDWPWAVETVLDRTKAGDVQLLVHCLGALTAMMSLMGGYTARVRNMIVSQFSVHPVTSWFNQMKADTHFAQLLHGDAESGMAAALAAMTGNPVIERLAEPRDLFDLSTRVPPAGSMPQQAQLDAAIDALVYSVPFPTGESCNSPTCHRVFGVFGPVYNHDQLNAATHDALNQVVGPVATWPFVQLSRIMQRGRAVSASGKDIYFDDPTRLDFPIHFISGEMNQLVLPSTTLRTQRWLKAALPKSQARFTRRVYRGYGHMDCLVGRDAGRDVIPDLIAWLDAQG